MTSDLRKYVPQENYLGNLSSVRIIETTNPSSFKPEYYLKHITSKTRKLKQNYSGLGMGCSFNSLLLLFSDKSLVSKSRVINIMIMYASIFIYKLG